MIHHCEKIKNVYSLKSREFKGKELAIFQKTAIMEIIFFNQYYPKGIV